MQSGAYPGYGVEFEVPYRIYLPGCYGASEEPLPTLYVFHGFPFDETHWESLGVQDRADALIASGQIEPLAIVMPRLPEPLFRSSDGGPWSYEAEMLQGLIPAIEAAYPVKSAGQARAVAGISRGGVWSLEIGMTHPEAFGAVAALSPALSVNAARPEYDPLLLSQLEPMPTRIHAGRRGHGLGRSTHASCGGTAGGQPVDGDLSRTPRGARELGVAGQHGFDLDLC